MSINAPLLCRLSAMFPPIYTSAIMGGQGLAGLVVSMSSVLTTASAPALASYCNDSPSDEGDECSQQINYSSLAYFTLATCILLSCIVSYLFLRQLQFARWVYSFSFHLIDNGSATQVSYFQRF